MFVNGSHIQHGRPVANHAQAVYNPDQGSKYGSVDLQLGLTAFNESNALVQDRKTVNAIYSHAQVRIRINVEILENGRNMILFIW